MKQFLPCLALTLLAAACNDSAKKIIVMSKGEPAINTDAKTITAKDGAGRNEKIFVLGGGDYSYKVKSPAGEGAADFKENGLYVVNAMNDTIIGSYQKYNDAGKANATITQEELKHHIDSLHQLMQGQNISAANRNYFILPNTAAKITSNNDAEIVGPYHQMRSAEKVDGKDPEVYRFYSIKEVREMVEKMEVLATPKKI